MRRAQAIFAVVWIISTGLIFCPHAQGGIVFPLPTLVSDPVATSWGHLEVSGTASVTEEVTSYTDSTRAHDGLMNKGVSAAFLTSASGGSSPRADAWAGAGNVVGSTGSSGSADGVAEVTYFFIIGSDLELSDPPAEIPILLNYELRTSGFEQHEYIAIFGLGDASIELTSAGGDSLFSDSLPPGGGWVNLNRVTFGHTEIMVPFNEWVQVDLYAHAYVRDGYGWTGVRHVGEVKAVADPTVMINPAFADAALFQIHQVSVAPPVPEPVALALFSFGGLILAQSRRFRSH